MFRLIAYQTKLTIVQSLRMPTPKCKTAPQNPKP